MEIKDSNFPTENNNAPTKINSAPPIKISLDLPNLIRTNNYYNSISFIKNYEDTLQKIFKSQNNSNLKNDEKIFLWEISKQVNCDLFENMIDFNYDDFGIYFNIIDENCDTSGIVAIGPYIRNCLVNIELGDNKKTSASIRKEIYLFRYKDTKWKDLIQNINEYTEKENEYVFEQDDKKICLVKKKYKSTSHILLQHDYIKRIGWENGSFYVSSMFLIEYQKHKSAIMSKFCDPILNIPYDPLEIFYLVERTKNPIKIIESVDIEELLKLSEKNITKLYNSKTLIEICMDKYMKEENIVLLENLEKMIVYLLNFKFKRPAYLYAQCTSIKLYQKNNEMYNFICEKGHKFENLQNLKIESKQNNVEDINNAIIEFFIKEDSPTDFIDFLMSIQQKINKHTLDLIIKNNSKNIIKELISSKIIEDYMAYHLILMTGNIELIEFMNFDMDTAINFLKDIIVNGIANSFFYLVENDNSVATTLFENNRNIFHMIKTKGDYDKIINKMMEMHPELVNVCDSLGETPIIYHSKQNPKIIENFLKYEDIIDLTIVDNDGNTCLHHLCKFDEPKILKNILKKYPELINMPNSKSEYPLLICCKNKLEEMFYVMKSLEADLDVRDTYGNTVYHYICANSMCLDMVIKNTQNFFGLTPKDYCNLSSKYYHFID
jgi:hypothetical protein